MKIAFSDTKIIDMLRSGKEVVENKALSHLYRQYFTGIRQWLNQKGLPVTVEATDIFQPAMMDLFFMVKSKNFQLSRQASLKSLLFTICQNRWKNEWRSHKRQRQLKEQLPEAESTRESMFEAIANEERKEWIADLVGRMGSRCQKLLYSYYYKRIKHEEIAEAMGFKTAQQSRNALSLCKKKLTKLIVEQPQWKNFLR